jgi:hypothetical protein
MANRRFIDFPIAASVGDNDIVLIWQEGLNKQTTKATLFAGSPNSLAGLTDVDISALANGQILQYNSTTSKWENVDRTDIDLDQLGDVTIVSPTNGQVLVYNSSTSKWENSSAGFVPYTGAVTTVNLGAQSILAGSFVKAGGTSAQFLKADGSIDSTAYGTGSVTSVALTMPTAFSVAGSPVTTTGTLAVTATGTTAQYIRGNGSLETFPSLTGFVPYTGATADVNLGTHDLTAERGTFQNNGSSDTLTVNHTSGSGYGIIVTKGGANEALYVSKTSGSGNAMTVVGGRTSLVDLALSSVTNTAGDFLTLSGGVVHKRTAAEVRTDIGAGTVTSVAALTLGTSGTDLSSTVANGTTTPVITLNVPTASATNRGALSSSDWSTFNSKQAQLNGTGFVKVSGTTISYDNTSYLPLTGGTLTGPLGGTSISLSGDITANRYRGVNSLVLNSYTTVNPSSNVYLYSPLGDRDAWIYLDSADTSSNWGIYHRQIDSAVSGLPANSIGFIGGGSSTLQAWISLATGNGFFAGDLTANNLSGTNTGNVTIGTANGLSLSGQALSLSLASGSANGALSSTDWTTFNNKQSAGNYVTTDTTQTITGLKTLSNSASAKLTLSGGTNQNGIVYSAVSSAPQYYLGSGSGLLGVDFGFIILDVADNRGVLYDNKNTGELRLSAPTFQSFHVNSSSRMAIFNDGNVSISNSPSNAGFKLDVNGTGRFLTNSNGFIARFTGGATGGVLGGFFANSTAGFASIGVQSNHDFKIFTNDTDRLTISASTGAATFTSSVGLGVTPNNSTDPILESRYGLFMGRDETNLLNNAYFSSGWKYAQTGFSNRLYLNSYTGGHEFYTAASGSTGGTITWGTPKLTITSGGNVLIGTTTDAGFKLDVNGTGRYTEGLLTTKTAKNTYAVQIKGAFYGAPRLQLYDLAVDPNAHVGLGVDMSGGAYEFSNYFPRTSGLGRWSVGSWAGDFGTGQYVSGYNEKLFITESAAQFNIPLTIKSNADGNSIALVGRSSDNESSIDFNNNSSSTFIATISADSLSMTIGSQINIPLRFYTNTTEKMHITSGGNVGIGNNGSLSGIGRTLTVEGTIISQTTAGGGFYNENFRANRAGNNYSAIAIGGAYGSSSGTGTGQWTLVATPSGLSYAFDFDYAGATVVKFTTSGEIRTGTLTGGRVPGFWKLGRAVTGTQPTNTEQIIVEINGVLYVIPAALL